MSLPTWEAETSRTFLVHGMSMLQFLMETVSAADKENATKRTKGRAGSVPPRATTPNTTNHLAPPTSGHGNSGVVTPAVRPASTLGSSQSVPNKRPRLGEVHTNRAPLGSSRGPSINRSASPTKIPAPGKAPTTTAGSSLPRPVPLAMPVPKPGTAHHGLGHGRLPSAQQLGASHSTSHGVYLPSHRAVSYMSTSTSSSTLSSSRYGPPSAAAVVAKKASRARRESFKPRPSVDENWAAEVALGGRRWAGLATTVHEEDEEY